MSASTLLDADLVGLRHQSLQYSHSLSDSPQHFQCLLQLLFRMRGGHDRTDAGLALGHGGEGDSGAQHAFFEQLFRELHGQFAVADDDWSNWSFAGRCWFSIDVKTEHA